MTKLRHKIILILMILTIPLKSYGADKIYIDINSPAGSRLPIAIQDIIGSLPEELDGQNETLQSINKDFRETVTNDLDFSGLFRVIDKEAFLEDASSGIKKHETNFYEWRVIGTEILVKGQVHIKEDRFYLTIRVYDTVKENRILGKRYAGYVDDSVSIAHLFADDLMETLTGVRGIFSTKLVFVSPATGNKEIYMSDYDGDNLRQITNNGSINLSPKWSPDGKKIIYTSYYKGRPQIFEHNIKSNKIKRLSHKKGLNISGRWAPNGDSIALALSVDGNSEIYRLNRNSLRYKRLTTSWALDVSPTWSPDGKQIAFTSNRAGNPHIYVVNSKKGEDKNKATRITFGGKYNSNPEWSPDGEWIVYEGLSGDDFQIWKVRPDGSDATMLTTESSNEMPSWSPDSRFIVYSSGRGTNQSLYMMRADGSGQRKIITGLGKEQMPHWSKYPNK